jgi:hypothetical protein
MAVALLVTVFRDESVFDYLAPTSPVRGRSMIERLVWYVEAGQLRADLRSLSSAVRYVVAREPKLPHLSRPADSQGPRQAAPS